jgi:small subunit ribosomal protein S8e
MDQYHKGRTKKVSAGTGGRRRKFCNKKLSHCGRVFTATKVGTSEVKISVRKRGGNSAIRLKKALFVNVVTSNGVKKVKILGVMDSPNPEYVRQNIITKGAVLNTEAGKVKVTNRVGQDGVVNGIQI